MRKLIGATIAVLIVAAACGDEAAVEPSTEPVLTTAPSGVSGSSARSTPASESAACADVVAVQVTATGDRTFGFDVTVASGDTGWDKYADAWEIRTPDGRVVGVRELLHPHVDEQPFTRSLAGVEIPEGVEDVVVAARDSVGGFCGETMTVSLG